MFLETEKKNTDSNYFSITCAENMENLIGTFLHEIQK